MLGFEASLDGPSAFTHSGVSTRMKVLSLVYLRLVGYSPETGISPVKRRSLGGCGKFLETRTPSEQYSSEM